VLAWYTADALAARSPDHVWIVSDAPAMRLPMTLPWWIHPQYSDALGNRITNLQRSPSP
jgi:hypothetical protein